MYKLLLLSLVILCTGCANSTRYTESAMSWESAPTHELITALGNPTFFYPAEDRGDILFWHFKKEFGLTSYVRHATQKLLKKDTCANPKMSFSEQTLCRSSDASIGVREEATMLDGQTKPMLADANAYDCQIVATLSEDGATVSKIDVIAEGNCDMLKFDSYRQLAKK